MKKKPAKKRPPTKAQSMRDRINDLEAQVTELQAELVRERWRWAPNPSRWRWVRHPYDCYCNG